MRHAPAWMDRCRIPWCWRRRKSLLMQCHKHRQRTLDRMRKMWATEDKERTRG